MNKNISWVGQSTGQSDHEDHHILILNIVTMIMVDLEGPGAPCKGLTCAFNIASNPLQP